MTASELIKNLTEIVKLHGDLELIYSSDDEGNNYDTVKYSATACGYDDYDMIDVTESEEKPTHICIN